MSIGPNSRRCIYCGKGRPRLPVTNGWAHKYCLPETEAEQRERNRDRQNQKRYKDRHPDRVFASQAKYCQKIKGSSRRKAIVSASNIRWRKRNGDKYRIHQMTHQAVRTGRLVRPSSCSECGSECKPDAHHEDYAKPLDVRWLCRSCHKIADRERQRKEQSQCRI